MGGALCVLCTPSPWGCCPTSPRRARRAPCSGALGPWSSATPGKRAPFEPVSQTPRSPTKSTPNPHQRPTKSTAGRVKLLKKMLWHKIQANPVHPHKLF